MAKLKVRKAVIPAAGLGTRFLPVTKALPKEMIPIIDKPMIHYIVEECVLAGIEQIILVTARGKHTIIDYFDHSIEIEEHLRQKNKSDVLKTVDSISNLTNIVAIRQKQPLGLGHAVLAAKPVIGDEPFAVILGDDIIVAKTPCIKQMIQVFEREQLSTIGVMEVPKKEVSKYGIIGGKKISDRLFKVSEMIEKPDPSSAPSCLACPGRYVLSHKIFEYLEQAMPGRGGEIQLTDSLDKLASKEGLLAYLFEGRRFDAGDKLGYIEATIAFALDRPDLSSGVKNILNQYR